MKKKLWIVVCVIAGVVFVAGIAVAFFAVSSNSKNKFDRHMEMAVRYVEGLEYERAIAEYESAIEIDPNNIKSYQALAELYVQAGDYESATEILNRGIERTESGELLEYLEEVQNVYEKQKGIAEESEQAEMEQRQEEGKDSQETADESLAREVRVEDADGSFQIQKYDDNGNNVSIIWYTADAVMDSYWVGEYDENGNLVQQGFYNGDGTLIAICDADGYSIESQENTGENLAREERVDDPNGGGYWIDEYDEEGKLQKSTRYYENSWLSMGIVYYIISEYDKNGNCVKLTYCDMDQQKLWYDVSEYDMQGNVIKTTTYETDGALRNYSTNEYDMNGNLLERVVYDVGGAITERSVYEYNENGQMIKITRYGRDGIFLSEDVLEQ